MKKPTDIGYESPNGLVTIRDTGRKASNHPFAKVYETHCTHCLSNPEINSCELHHAVCPECHNRGAA